MTDLWQRSIEIIRAGQATSGAYVASPTFSQYGYSWLRDGMWIAYGMDKAGQGDSARAFHLWAAQTLLRYEGAVDALLATLARGETPQESDYLPTRFKLDGTLGQEAWTDFQLDGYGAWLWGLAQYVREHDDRDLWQAARPAVVLTARYLGALWQSPNYDCWEEHRHQIHPATLAALYGGLSAVDAYEAGIVAAGLPEAIRAYTLANGVSHDGHFMKYLGNEEVDASLLWLALPYGLVSVDDPRFVATVAKIERDIHRAGGGVYRYRADTYYGGGEWLLLTLWLAWAYIEQGRRDDAAALVAWVEAQAREDGEMPEQVEGHILDESYLQPWIERWGTSACPLLWSHGMYLVVKGMV
jgi:GH15 family glucan-1,4-alpha-glucosidase